MKIDLSDFLEDYSSRPFAWGVSDCALMVADWSMAATGCSDPAAHLRGRYSTPLGAHRFIANAGGFVSVVDSCASAAGLSPTETPARGDIGVVEVRGLPYAAICLSDGIWAIHSHMGVSGARAQHMAAWSVPNG